MTLPNISTLNISTLDTSTSPPHTQTATVPTAPPSSQPDCSPCDDRDPYRVSTSSEQTIKCCVPRVVSRSVSRALDELSKMNVIGAGGFGTIYGDSLHVYKTFTKVKSCADSHYEFSIGKKLYDTIQRLNLQGTIVTPEPIEYGITPFVYMQNEYQCFFKMKRMRGFVIDKADQELLVHATLQYPDKNSEEGKQAGRPVDETNPSRGWFAGENFIEAITGVAPKTIAYRIGLVMVLLIMDVGVYPFDVEYLINKSGQLVVLDFGLAMEIENYDDMIAVTKKAFEDGGNGAIGMAYDLYYPEQSSEVAKSFLNGVERGTQICKNPEKARAIVDFVEDDLNLKRDK